MVTVNIYVDINYRQEARSQNDCSPLYICPVIEALSLNFFARKIKISFLKED